MSNLQSNQIIKNEIPFRDKFPTLKIDIKKIEIIDIHKKDKLGFLHKEYKIIIINDTIKFVLSKDLVGIIQLGFFKIWYSCEDERYVKIMMVGNYE